MHLSVERSIRESGCVIDRSFKELRTMGKLTHMKWSLHRENVETTGVDCRLIIYLHAYLFILKCPVVNNIYFLFTFLLVKSLE